MTPAELDEAIKALPPYSDPVAYRDTWQAQVGINQIDLLAVNARLALVLQVVREYTEAVDKVRSMSLTDIDDDDIFDAAIQTRIAAEANLRTILQLEGV